MIFAMFGTNPYQFTRLAQALDGYAEKTGERVEVQCGNTQYVFKHCLAQSFMPREDALAKMREARCLVVQGGAGSISDGLRLGKPMVVVPRRPELNESYDRQEDLARALEKMGCTIVVEDVKELGVKIKQALSYKASQPPANRIPSIIRKFLEEL